VALAKRGRRKPRGVPPVETVLQLRLHGTIVLPTSKRSVALPAAKFCPGVTGITHPRPGT